MPRPISGNAIPAAERMRRMRAERRRQEDEAKAKAHAEAQRQALLARDCRRALGAFLDSLPTTGNRITTTLQNAGWTETDWPEAQLKIGEIIRALQSGRDRLP